MRVKRVYFFDAAHVLLGYCGKCANLHGHTYRVEIVVEGDLFRPSEAKPYGSMVLDFHKLDEVVKPIIDELDHALLLGDDAYDKVAEALESFNFKIVRVGPDPTAEVILMWIAERVKQGLSNLPVKLRSVTVCETEKAAAVYD